MFGFIVGSKLTALGANADRGMLRREIEFLGDAAVAMEELAVDHGARMDDVNRRYNSVLKHHPPFIVEKYSTIGRRQQANPIEADRP